MPILLTLAQVDHQRGCETEKLDVTLAIGPSRTKPKHPHHGGVFSVRQCTLEALEVLLGVVIGPLDSQDGSQSNDRQNSSPQRCNIYEFTVLQTLDHALSLDQLLDENDYECHLADEGSVVIKNMRTHCEIVRRRGNSDLQQASSPNPT
jgi:hypothetical protein